MKKLIKLMCILLSLTILTSSFLVKADSFDSEEYEDTLSDEYEAVLLGNIESAINDIFNEENQDDNSTEGIMPRWGKEQHEDSVDDSYGTQLTAFLKTMSMVPDSRNYTLRASTDVNDGTYGNYFNLEPSDYITLSNGSKFICLPDNSQTEPFTFKYKYILHGRGNYVASLRFLYRVARNLVNNTYSGTRIEKIRQAINDSLEPGDIENGTLFGENKNYAKALIKWTEIEENSDEHQYIEDITAVNQFTSLQQRIGLEKSIYLVANYWFVGQNDAFNELLNSGRYNNVSSNNAFQIKTAIKIIGIATHLCGDIYAHKSVVPINVNFIDSAPTNRADNAIYKGAVKGIDFNGNGRWSAKHGIKTLVSNGSTITTQQILQWQHKNDNKTGYPDFEGFYNSRLSNASNGLVANMYDNFFNSSNLGNMGFYVNWFLHSNYTIRLADLKLYTYSIGSQPTQADRLAKLNNLDSTVAMSDVVPAGGYKTPSEANNPWKKGYVSSY